MPAEVAAVLEDLAARAALVYPPVLPQLPDQLPPDAVSARQNQTPLEGDAAALMMGEPARLSKQTGKMGGGLGLGGASSRLVTVERALCKFSQLDERKEGGAWHRPASGASRRERHLE